MNRPNLSKETSQIQADPQVIKCFRFDLSARNPQSFDIERKRPIKISYTAEIDRFNHMRLEHLRMIKLIHLVFLSRASTL